MNDDFTSRLARVATLLEELEKSEEPRVREAAREVVLTLLDLHRRGLGFVDIRLGAVQPTQARFGIGHGGGQRLVYLVCNGGRELAERRDARGVRKL